MKGRKGFTLVELLVVIAIIGILSTVAVVNLNSARDKAKVAAVQGSLSAMIPAIILCNNSDVTIQNGAGIDCISSVPPVGFKSWVEGGTMCSINGAKWPIIGNNAYHGAGSFWFCINDKNEGTFFICATASDSSGPDSPTRICCSASGCNVIPW